MTGRFVHLVRQGTAPTRILAVTFTKKAADEMRRRIAVLMQLPSADGLNVMTFHAFAAGAIDFADMVPLVAKAMARDQAYRRAITGAYDHVLVDRQPLGWTLGVCSTPDHRAGEAGRQCHHGHPTEHA